MSDLSYMPTSAFTEFEFGAVQRELNTWDNGPAPFAMYGMLHGSSGSKSSQPVLSGAGDDPGLAGAMFDSVEEAGAGLVAPWLFDRAQWHIQVPKQVVGSTKLTPPACGPGPF